MPTRRRPPALTRPARPPSWSILIAGSILTLICQVIAIAGTLSIFKTMTMTQSISINVGFTVVRLLFASRPSVRVFTVLIVTVVLYVYWLFALNYGVEAALAALGLGVISWASWAVAATLVFIPDYLVAYGLGYAPPIKWPVKDVQS